MRVVVLLRKLAALDTGKPLIHRVLGIASNLNRTALLYIDLYSTEGMAEATEGLLSLNNHGISRSAEALAEL